LVEVLNGDDRPRRRPPKKCMTTTLNKKLSAIRSFLVFAEAQEWRGRITVPKSEPLEVQPPRWLNRNEERALMRAVERENVTRDVCLITVLFHCGLRVAESASLAWENIKITDRKGSMEITGKGRKKRRLPINVEARTALQALKEENKHNLSRPNDGRVFVGQRGPLSASALWRIVARYGRNAKLDTSPHELRHTFCHKLAQSGARLEEIATLTGHESIETTRRYVEPGQEELAAAVERIAGGDG